MTSDYRATGFVAHSAVWNMDPLVNVHLKLSTLLFDTLYLTTPFVIDPFEFVDGPNEIEEVSDSSVKEVLSEIWQPRGPDTPEYCIYGPGDTLLTPSSAPQLYDAATDAVHVGWPEAHPYEQYKLAIYTVSEIIYWRMHFHESAFIGHQISNDALHQYATLGREEGSAAISEVEKVCPDVMQLRWKDVIDLRRSPFLGHFRKKFNELQRSGRTEDLLSEYGEALEKLADEVRPSVGDKLGLAVLSNLPIPLNPFHIGSSVQEVLHARHLDREFGWTFFLRDLRHLGRTHASVMT